MTSTKNGPLWGAAADAWAKFQEPTCAPVYREVFARMSVGAGTDYADLGCGAGLAAEIAAARGARVSGLDAAEALVAIACRRVPAGDFCVGELEHVPFADGSFDLVTGFNSFQYAGDPGRALLEAKLVARAGAYVVEMVWGPPQGMQAASLLAALRPLLPPPLPGTPGPFALSDEQALRGLATNAGLAVEDLFLVDSPWRYASLEDGLQGLGSSGVAARAAAFAGREAVDAAHEAALRPFRQTDGSFMVGAAFLCLVARA